MASIVVAGYMIRHPFAGNMLAYFQYLLGLTRLGHDVVYVEEAGWPNACYDPAANTYSDDPAPGLAALATLFAHAGVRVPVAYVDTVNGRYTGIGRDELRARLRDADLLLNLGGVCWLDDFALANTRALVDMDPLFTQLGRFGGRLEHYDCLFSYGVNIGKPSCSVPMADRAWLPTVPPVVAALFERNEADTVPDDDAPLTTIANWSAYGAITHQGREYGQKDVEFRRLNGLPRQAPYPLELALSGADADATGFLREAGWRLRAARDVSLRFDDYRRYIMQSAGEFSVAKQAYVATNSGWFSDRSVCYLAAGRPVVLQDTGFSDWLHADAGVLAFRSAAQALDRLRALQHDPAAHRHAARRIAAERFAHDRVLPALLARAL